MKVFKFFAICFHRRPSRFTRSTSSSSNPANEGDSNGELVSGHNENIDMMSWLHGHTVIVGNSSETDLRAILNSMKLINRPESLKFPRLKVYNYNFDDGDMREVLVYSDPDEEKQWIITIEDLDLRQNLIVFKLGDLGFGFRRKNTYVVLRKSMSSGSTFHYVHLAYIQPRKKSKGSFEVEWDNLKPRDLLPIPLILNEPVEDHEEHCDARKCGLKEFIFGTCPIVKLSCEDLKKLPLEGHEKERIEALLREKQPFIYELAKSLSVNKQYLKDEGNDQSITYRTKRSSSHGSTGEMGGGNNAGDNVNTPHFGEGGIGHRSVKKDHALVAAASHSGGDSEVRGVEAAMQAFQRKLLGDKMTTRTRLRAPGMESGILSQSQTMTSSIVRNYDSPGSAMEEFDKPLTSASMGGINLDEVDAGNMETIRYSRSSDTMNHTTNDKRIIQKFERNNKSVPSSAFDKLLLKKTPVTVANLTLGIVPIQSPVQLPPEEKSYFENVLEKIRNSPPSKYTVRPYECVACETFGNFMAEYAENPLVSYVVNNLIGDIFRDVIHKRNLFSPESNEVLQEHGKIPFVGYGPCEFSVDALDKSPKSTELDDIIDFYSETLAVNCEKKDCESQRPRVRMRELLTSRYHLLEIWPDLTIRINKTSELPKYLVLSTNEFRQFMVSLIFSAYTIEYRMQTMNHIDQTLNNIPNQHISPRMKFLTRLILRVVDDLVKNFPQHVIKGLRYILQVLQEKYLTLIAEQLAILEFDFKGNEKERNVYKIINKSDRLQVLAVKDFIINGVAPILRSNGQSLPAFTTFFNRNRQRIQNMVIEQGIGHEHKTKSGNKTVRSAEVDIFWATLNGEGSNAELNKPTTLVEEHQPEPAKAPDV